MLYNKSVRGESSKFFNILHDLVFPYLDYFAKIYFSKNLGLLPFMRNFYFVAQKKQNLKFIFTKYRIFVLDAGVS